MGNGTFPNNRLFSRKAVAALRSAPIDKLRPIFANVIYFAELHPMKVRLGLFAPLMRAGSTSVQRSMVRRGGLGHYSEFRSRETLLRSLPSTEKCSLFVRIFLPNAQPTSRSGTISLQVPPTQNRRADHPLGCSALLWCAGGDLNPHAFRHMHLKHACLPVPPPARAKLQKPTCRPPWLLPERWERELFQRGPGRVSPPEP